LVAALLVACGGDDGEDSGGSGGTTTSTGVGGFVGAGGASDDGCADEARSVYLLGKGRELVRFDPGTLSLEEVGKLNCPVEGGPNVELPTPRSMAVDRSGTAYVHYTDGSLFIVDVKTAQCSVSGYQPGQLSAFHLFGMGFSSDSPGSTKETLFISSHDPGDGIATLDPSTMTIDRVGFYGTGTDGPAELTGTGDAELHGFFLTDPVQVAQLDKTTSKVIDTVSLPSVDIGTAWAFAFWGDDFWLFTAPGGITSQITRMHRGSVVTEVVVEDAGLLVVGAGVSTCAPVEPPK
jgi:hypothetical protein